jgi:hypothetical protein
MAILAISAEDSQPVQSSKAGVGAVPRPLLLIFLLLPVAYCLWPILLLLLFLGFANCQLLIANCCFWWL